jgi:hypothetical protein
VLVVSNAALLTFQGMDSLTHIHGHLNVRNNSALTTLEGTNVSFVQLSVEVRAPLQSLPSHGGFREEVTAAWTARVRCCDSLDAAPQARPFAAPWAVHHG